MTDGPMTKGRPELRTSRERRAGEDRRKERRDPPGGIERRKAERRTDRDRRGG